MISPIKDLEEKLEEIKTQIKASIENKNTDDLVELKIIRDQYQSSINIIKCFKDDNISAFPKYSSTVGKGSKDIYIQVSEMHKEIEELKGRQNYLYSRINRLTK